LYWKEEKSVIGGSHVIMDKKFFNVFLFSKSIHDLVISLYLNKPFCPIDWKVNEAFSFLIKKYILAF
jgi:hypothetical protein